METVHAPYYIRVVILVFKNCITDQAWLQEARNRNCLLSALPSLTNRSSVYKEKVNGFFF